METVIKPNLRKPFRGLTTIQLFDKETGNLLEEYHDENTYNDRLQYLSYLDSILHCKSPKVSNHMTHFNRVNLLEDPRENHLINICNARGLGISNRVAYVYQLFATLLLTNDTETEDAHGYFNGMPVGIATSAGNDTTYEKYACTGAINLSESYIGNDRLHLVFDFNTDKCNVSFDALWLFPSCLRYYDSDVHNYAVINPFQVASISREVLPYTFIKDYTYVYSRRLNNRFLCLKYTNYNEHEACNGISIIDNESGETISTITFANTQYINGQYYYYPTTNTLYYFSTENYNLSGILGNSTSFVLNKLNIEDGTTSRVNTLYNLFNLSWDDLGLLSSKGGNFDLLSLYINEDAYVAVRISGTDSDLKASYYLILYKFAPSTGSFDLVKKIKLYSNPFNDEYCFLYGNLLYMPYKINANAKSHNTYSCIDIKTGQIKADNIIGIAADLLSNQRTSTIPMDYRNYYPMYVCHDLKDYRQPLLGVSSSTVSSAGLVKSQYMTSFWSTHNKLSSIVKKTDMTTMKIQYDIIWDNIDEQIIPQLI